MTSARSGQLEKTLVRTRDRRASRISCIFCHRDACFFPTYVLLNSVLGLFDYHILPLAVERDKPRVPSGDAN